MIVEPILAHPPSQASKNQPWKKLGCRGTNLGPWNKMESFAQGLSFLKCKMGNNNTEVSELV